MRCAQCGTELPDEARFCLACGIPQAQLAGSGAIAQGEGAVAAGERGVAAREIRGTVVTGDYAIVNELPPQVLELFARQFGFDPAASDAEALRTYFNNVVLERHSKLSFLFIRPETGRVYTEADVESVFVPLRMTDPDAIEREKQLARRMERFERLPREAEEAACPVTLPDVLRKYLCFRWCW